MIYIVIVNGITEDNQYFQIPYLVHASSEYEARGYGHTRLETIIRLKKYLMIDEWVNVFELNKIPKANLIKA